MAHTNLPLIRMQSLAGRTVVITRARAQAEEFVAELQGYGARVIALSDDRDC